MHCSSVSIIDFDVEQGNGGWVGLFPPSSPKQLKKRKKPVFRFLVIARRCAGDETGPNHTQF